MKSTQCTRLMSLSLLAFALTFTASPIDAQQGQRGQRDQPRNAPAAPVQRGPADAQPVQRGPAERDRTDQRRRRAPGDGAPLQPGPMNPGPPAFAPGAAGPAAGLMAEVVPFWDRPMVSERMSLTEEQLTALKSSYEKARPAIQTSNEKMRDSGHRIAVALNGDSEPDIAAVRKAVGEFTDAQKQGMLAALEHRANVQKTLNDEQLANLRQMRQRVRVPGMMDGRMMDGRDMEERMRDPRAGRPDTPDQPRTLPDLPGRADPDAPRQGARREYNAQDREERIRERLEEHRERLEERRESEEERRTE